MSSIPFPLEVIISETPVSAQGSAAARNRWIAVVADQVRQRLNEITDWFWLDDRITSVTIYYFPLAAMQGDVDNIIKPILDGMKGLIFPDDHVVERVLVQRFEPDLSWSFLAPTSQLARALDTPPPVVYTKIDDDLSWRQIG